MMDYSQIKTGKLFYHTNKRILDMMLEGRIGREEGGELLGLVEELSKRHGDILNKIHNTIVDIINERE